MEGLPAQLRQPEVELDSLNNIFVLSYLLTLLKNTNNSDQKMAGIQSSHITTRITVE